MLGIARFLAGASPKVMAAVGIGGAAVGTAATVDYQANGAQGWAGGLVEGMNRILGEAGARAKAATKAEGFYAFIEQIGVFFMNLTNGAFGSGLTNWARKAQGLGPTEHPDAPQTPSQVPLANGQNLSVTRENEFSLTNLGNGLKNATVHDLIEKPMLFGQGAWNEVATSGASVAGHVADLGDWVSGKVLSVVGVDTGYQSRDLSKSFLTAAQENATFKPELTTAWDRAAFGAGGFAPYIIPAYGVSGLAAKTAVTAGTLGAGMARDYDLTP